MGVEKSGAKLQEKTSFSGCAFPKMPVVVVDVAGCWSGVGRHAKPMIRSKVLDPRYARGPLSPRAPAVPSLDRTGVGAKRVQIPSEEVLGALGKFNSVSLY